MNSEDELDIRHYVEVIRRRVWLLLMVVVVCAVSAATVSLLQSKVYEASSRVVLSSQSDAITSSGMLSSPNAFSDQLGTQVQVVKSPEVVKAATTQLGARASKIISISAHGVTNTRIMAISVRSKDRAVARDAADAYTTAYLTIEADSSVARVLSIGDSVQRKQADLRNQAAQLDQQINANPAPANVDSLRTQRASIDAQLTQLQQRYDQVQADATVRDSTASLLASADLPTSPVSPKPIRNTALAIVLGMLLGVGLILLIDRFDDRVRTAEDLAKYGASLTVLGSVPRVTDWKDTSEAKTITLLDSQSKGAEAYRRMRTSIEFAGLKCNLKVIEVTSTVAGEGKSTTVANLATALAWAGKKVIVVAADLRRPRMHDFFGLSDEVGLTSVLLSEARLDDVLQEVPGFSEGTLRLLGSGPLPPNPAEVLSSARVTEVFKSLRKMADYVIIDSPPVLPVADPLVLSAHADGVLLVAGAGKLHGRQFEKSLDILETSTRAPIIGAVINGAVAEPGYQNRYDRYYNYNCQGTGLAGKGVPGNREMLDLAAAETSDVGTARKPSGAGSANK